MPEVLKTLQLSSFNREGIRSELIKIFLDENPGTGKGDLCSKYIYYVDEIEDGRRVYLKRPALFNKGFDFGVHVENTNFCIKKRATTMPSHESIFIDLQNKSHENPLKYKQVSDIIDRIYNCKNIPNLEFRSIQFDTGHKLEIILKVIQWLFIEQDITYWNWSGRAKLYSYLQKIK